MVILLGASVGSGPQPLLLPLLAPITKPKVSYVKLVYPFSCIDVGLPLMAVVEVDYKDLVAVVLGEAQFLQRPLKILGATSN